MTDVDKVMNSQRFGSDPADIRIRINPEMWIRIPDHFWLRFRRRFALSEHSLVITTTTVVVVIIIVIT